MNELKWHIGNAPDKDGKYIVAVLEMYKLSKELFTMVNFEIVGYSDNKWLYQEASNIIAYAEAPHYSSIDEFLFNNF